MKAREIAVSYTWDATVRQLLNCFSDCKKKKSIQSRIDEFIIVYEALQSRTRDA